MIESLIVLVAVVLVYEALLVAVMAAVRFGGSSGPPSPWPVPEAASPALNPIETHGDEDADAHAAAALCRISDAERQRAAKIIGEAMADGRLGIEEGVGRLEQACEGVTAGDLAAVVGDLRTVETASRPSWRHSYRRDLRDVAIVAVVAAVTVQALAGLWALWPVALVAVAAHGCWTGRSRSA